MGKKKKAPPSLEMVNEYKSSIKNYNVLELEKLRKKKNLIKWQMKIVNETYFKKLDYDKNNKYFRRVKDDSGRVILENNDNTSTLYIYSEKEMSNILYEKTLYLNKEVAKKLLYFIKIKYRDIVIGDIQIYGYKMETNIAKFNFINKYPGYKMIKSTIPREIKTKKVEKIQKKKKFILTDVKIPRNNQRLFKCRNYTRDLYLVFEENEVISKLQLIKSANNHSSRNHSIISKKFYIPYQTDIKGMYNTIEVVAHYCKNCDIYFDYFESFKLQLKNIHIDLSDLMIKIVDEHGKILNLGSAFDNESILKQYGYTVGKTNGVPRTKRREIIESLIKNNILTAIEIKNLLSSFVRYQGKRNGMENAVDDWEEDIQYINDMIKRGVF